MWHVVHLIARPIEALLGVFCVVTAVLLYPNEDGKIQSKLEDLWVRVDDFERAASSWSAQFMMQVARLETHLFDRVFGSQLFSVHALTVSCSVSLLSAVAVQFIFQNSVFPSETYVQYMTRSIVICLLSAIVLILAIRFYRSRPRVLGTILVADISAITIWMSFDHSVIEMESKGYGLIFSLALVASFICDIGFIALTRQLIRRASESNSFVRVLSAVLLNSLLGLILFVPIYVVTYAIEKWEDTRVIPELYQHLEEFCGVLGVFNLVDFTFALIFFALVLLALTHRAVWPLLSRTLFRMTDIGTKGRRAILTTVGFALLAAGVTGKVPELVQKLIEKLGG
jgi:hypothetical protein